MFISSDTLVMSSPPWWAEVGVRSRVPRSQVQEKVRFSVTHGAGQLEHFELRAKLVPLLSEQER